MFTNIGSISWLSVLLAAGASFILGGVWFAAFFPGLYLRALGREDAQVARPTALFFVGPLLCGLVTAATTAWLINALDLRSKGDAIAFGAVIGFGYLTSTTVNTAINPNIPRPLLYGLVSGSFFFLSSIVVAVIIVAMR